MQDDNYDYPEDELEIISKTSIKKECHALQDLGAALCELKDEKLARLPLDDTLRNAIIEMRNIRKFAAQKRHMQFIGKLIRNGDAEAIQAAYNELEEEQLNDARRSHMIEDWRDRLLGDEPAQALQDFFDNYPMADRQQIRQFIKNAQTEKAQNKPPTQARKLFKLLRDTLNQTL